MRSDAEMLDLVRSKVHRRQTRRRALATAGGSLAVVVLVAIVAVGTGGPDADDNVYAGPGDPTTTATSTAPSTPSTTETPTTTTTAPPETTTTPSTTEPAPTTEATPTTEAPPVVTTKVVAGVDGDLRVQFTLSTDSRRPGHVVVRVEASDPTGAHQIGEYVSGIWGIVSRQGAAPAGPDDDSPQEHQYYGDTVAGCGGVESREAEGVRPSEVDTTVELVVPSGPQQIRLFSTSLFCMDDYNQVEVFTEVVVP